MAKTACEEAADILDDVLSFDPVPDDLAKRLRAEGRELRRLRKLIELVCAEGGAHKSETWSAVVREAFRIQKARKK